MVNIYKFNVHFGDTDPAGIVFYPNFYRWMDQATHDFIATTYMKTSQLMSEKKIATPLLEAKCQFKTPLFFEDKVEVYSKVIEINEKVFKIKHQFKRGETIVAEGYEIRAWASFNDKGIKAIPIPEEVRKAFK